MSIRPIDMSVLIHKSPEVNNTQNSQNNRAETMQHNFASQFQKEEKHKEQQVVTLNKSEGQNVSRDGKGYGSFGGSNAQKKKKEEEKKTVKYKDDEVSLLDIRI